MAGYLNGLADCENRKTILKYLLDYAIKSVILDPSMSTIEDKRLLPLPGRCWFKGKIK